MVTSVHRDQDLIGFAGTYGCGDRGCDLAQQGIGKDNTDRSDDDVRISSIYQNRIFAGGTVVSSCLQHGRGGDAVRADGVQLQFLVGGFQLFDDRLTDTAALTVYYCNFHLKISNLQISITLS